jgi:hypothetical protein
MTKKTGFAPPVGRMSTPKKYLRDDVDNLRAVDVTSDLDLHIERLRALHPALKVRFRSHDLAALDDATKRALLDDMNHVLGIRPLKARRS